MATEHLVVLAAGRGTRMDPLTRTRPKVLLPVAGRPLMEHIVSRAAAAGFRRSTFVVHEGAQQVRDHFGDGSAWGLAIGYVDQGATGGTGHAVAALEGHVEGDVVLVSGDSVLSVEDLRRLRAQTETTVGAQEVPDARAFGLLDVQDGRMHGVQEKPAEATAGQVNAGAYLLDEDLVRACRDLRPSARGERELTDALQARAAAGAPPAVLELPSWREAGRPWDLLGLQEHLMQDLTGAIEGDVGERVDLEGLVVVAPGARIHNGVRIEGPVIVGADARIGPNAYLRGSTAIGEGCHVGAGVEIKNSILGDHSHVPHLSYVGDSVLGSGCNLGAGTQVANLKHSDRAVRVRWKGQWLDTGRRKLGLIAGDGVRTGVNSSINPGTVLCPGVRVPAGGSVQGWVEVEPL